MSEKFGYRDAPACVGLKLAVYKAWSTRKIMCNSWFWPPWNFLGFCMSVRSKANLKNCFPKKISCFFREKLVNLCCGAAAAAAREREIRIVWLSSGERSCSVTTYPVPAAGLSMDLLPSFLVCPSSRDACSSACHFWAEFFWILLNLSRMIFARNIELKNFLKFPVSSRS